MSQHDNSQQDKVFVRNFSFVLGVLIMAAIGAYVLASGVTGSKGDQQADGIKPVAEVQVATAETKAAAPAATPAKEETAKPAEAAPAEATAKPAETAPAAEATAKPAETAPAAEAAAKPAETAPAEGAAKPAEAATGGAVTTDQISALMTQKGYSCMACHQVEAKLVGPSFKEIGAKYKGDAQAAAALATKVKAGGVGAWGQMPMPPNPSVTDEDMKTIVDWVLALQ